MSIIKQLNRFDYQGFYGYGHLSITVTAFDFSLLDEYRRHSKLYELVVQLWVEY